METPKITIENICRICGEKQCDDPCKIYYECLAGEEISIEELLKARKRRKTLMNEQEMELKLNDHDHEIGSLKHRMDSVEEKQDEIYELTTAVNKLAISVEFMAKEQKDQGKRLKTLENEPTETAKFYKRTIATAIITAVAGAVIGAVLALLI